MESSREMVQIKIERQKKKGIEPSDVETFLDPLGALGMKPPPPKPPPPNKQKQNASQLCFSDMDHYEMNTMRVLPPSGCEQHSSHDNKAGWENTQLNASGRGGH